LKLDRAELVAEFGGECVKGDLGEWGESEVVGNGVNFVASDEVCLRVGVGLEGWDVADCKS
jgi:hypothetical protein